MRIQELMVPNPICAEVWHPLSFIRQTMLESSFSYLPVRTTSNGESAWKIVADVELALYLRTAINSDERRRRLVQTLADAQKAGGIQLRDPKTCGPEELISDLFKRGDGQKDWNGLPILVVRSGTADLLGILTPFDLL
jgi:CBS domain-containing protein